MVKLATLNTLAKLEQEMARAGRTAEEEALREARRALARPERGFLTMGQAAERLGVSIPTVKQWLGRGALTGGPLADGRWRVSTESVDHLVSLRESLLELDREPDIRVLLHGYNKGKGAALRTGFQEACGDVVLIQDADLEYNPNDLPRLLEPIERGEADVVYGSRFLENAEQDPSRLHRLGNWLLTAASNLTTGQRLTDMETCYKLFRREVLEAIDFEKVRSNGYSFQIEMSFRAWKKGFRLVEIPIVFTDRMEGQSKMNKRIVREAIWMVWWLRLRSLVGRL